MTQSQPRSADGAGLLAEAAFRAGVRQFNAGEYFACHETLEALWLQLGSPRHPHPTDSSGQSRHPSPPAAAERLLVQGLIQLAVALYKWQQGNRRGALLLQRQARLKWATLPPQCAGIDLTHLAAAVETAFAPLAAALATEPLPPFPADLAPVIALPGDRP